MSDCSTSAIILRQIDYGDDDLIVTLFTRDTGKISAIAKHAKRSIKRFPGILELFSVLEVVYKNGRGKLPILQEAVLTQPFFNIRCDIKKTAYASFWAELINDWTETGETLIPLYRLFEHVLAELDRGNTPVEVLSILFQIRFLTMSGLTPNLIYCNTCGIKIEQMKNTRVIFDHITGGIVCETCEFDSSKCQYLSKGTIKQLLWVATCEPEKAQRLRFTPQSLSESQECMETFVSYHLGKKPKSLTFLQRIRSGCYALR